VVVVLHRVSGLARGSALGARRGGLSDGSFLGPGRDGAGSRSRAKIAVSHPCALEVSRTIYIFFASDVGGLIRIAMATSSDGLSWDRRGTVLEPEGKGPTV
jgi:hypothetical protein